MTKEERKIYNREYTIKNKEKRREYNVLKWSMQKDGYYKVYLLEDYNYVGQTENSLEERFSQHKKQNNRDCTNHRLLYRTKNKQEALELEKLLHDLGYSGQHSNNSMKVYAYEYYGNKFIGEYNSQSDAERILNLTKGSVSAVIRKKRLHINGYRFERS